MPKISRMFTIPQMFKVTIQKQPTGRSLFSVYPEEEAELRKMMEEHERKAAYWLWKGGDPSIYSDKADSDRKLSFTGPFDPEEYKIFKKACKDRFFKTLEKDEFGQKTDVHEQVEPHRLEKK